MSWGSSACILSAQKAQQRRVPEALRGKRGSPLLELAQRQAWHPRALLQPHPICQAQFHSSFCSRAYPAGVPPSLGRCPRGLDSPITVRVWAHTSLVPAVSRARIRMQASLETSVSGAAALGQSLLQLGTWNPVWGPAPSPATHPAPGLTVTSLPTKCPKAQDPSLAGPQKGTAQTRGPNEGPGSHSDPSVPILQQEGPGLLPGGDHTVGSSGKGRCHPRCPGLWGRHHHWGGSGLQTDFRSSCQPGP